MRELLIRTLSGAVLVAVIIACVMVSPWTWAALGLLIVAVGTIEMSRLQKIERRSNVVAGELLSIGTFAVAALTGLDVLPKHFLIFELVFCMLPFLLALFSTADNYKRLAAFTFGSMTYLSLPVALMLFMYRKDFFMGLSGPKLLLLIFALLWVNDTFAYLTGRLLGKHKLFPRISPGKTIEGSIGGLVFTIAGIIVFSHFVDWLPMKKAIGMGLIAVVFGTLGDLCESMLKRQAGVKDSGKLIPGHGGILDRFDSVLFAVPFVFVFLLLV
ncbi:MAG: phosphatidate cytidylyltransferase [Bacteroidales bacterium]|nr:phosphatidate cytidylyltransferase [Bacteroidales bacterium]